MKTNPRIKIALAALAFLLIAAASPFIDVTVDSVTGALRGSSTNLFSANSNRLNSAVNLSSRVAKGGDTMTGTLAVPAITLNGTNLADLIGTGGGGGGGGGPYQPTSGVLTAFAAATGGNPSNFYAGDGTYKQVTTNMIPGLVQALADGVAGGGGGSYPSNIASSTITNTGNAVVGGNLDVAGSITIGGSNVADVAEAQVKGRWIFYKEYDFFTPSANRINAMLPEATAASIGNGTVLLTTSGSPLTNHYGVYRVTAGTSANNGYSYLTDASAFSLSGGEYAEFTFRVVSTNFTRTTFGFFDNSSGVTPTDGIVLRTAANLGEWDNFAGYVYNNGSAQGSSTSTHISQGVWYIGTLSNSVPSGTVTFQLLSENRSLIWSSTVTTGFPSGSGREFGYGWSAISTNLSAISIFDIDKAIYGVRR